MADLTIIAEAAQGYEGKRELAMLLVTAAARAKADGIKFQLVYADELATPDYQHYQLFKSLEMPDQVWTELGQLANQAGIGLYLDVFGSRSLKLAEELSCPGIKIHSTDMANRGLLQEVASSSVPMVMLSTAGCSDAEIVEVVRLFSRKIVVLLHGFQGYPTPVEANNIARIPHLHLLLKQAGHDSTSSVGFADHADPDDPARFLLPAAAIGAGALMLEKHITLSKIVKFEDHEAALNPDELAEFVVQMRTCHSGVGNAEAMHDSELEYRRKTRKHVVAARDIRPDETITPDMIGLLRTSNADAIYDARPVYGKRVKKEIKAGFAITAERVEE